MPAPRLPEGTTTKIEDEWAANPGKSAAWVHRELEKRYWKGFVGIRKVQEVVKDLKERGGGRFNPEQWHAWTNSQESAADSAYLLELDRMYLDLAHRRMWQHEAQWAQRLRVALRDLPLESQWLIVTIYGLRELSARNRGLHHAITIDLNDLLMFKPWMSRQHEVDWYSALDKRAIRTPQFGPFLQFPPKAPERFLPQQLRSEMEALCGTDPQMANTMDDIARRGILWSTIPGPGTQEAAEIPAPGGQPVRIEYILPDIQSPEAEAQEDDGRR